MKIIVDTNVVVSGIFFGGYPRRVIESVLDDYVVACVSLEILDEYKRVIQEMIERKQGRLDEELLSPLFNKMNLIEPTSSTNICRDPDDNKFLNCAKDSDALYIVSGDEDLLILKEYGVTKIITAKEFCDKYL